MLGELEERGFVLRRGVVPEPFRTRILAVCNPEGIPEALRYRSGVAFAARALLVAVPALEELLQEAGTTDLARSVLGARAFPIDAILFDKRVDANWTVPGHQDRSMPVADPVPPGGRLRGGVPYVQPSARVLAGLLALRIHFDPCGEDSGALQLVPGSHRLGVVSDHGLRDISLDRYETCSASPGDVLLMRPLVLHRSVPSKVARRRVLHVVYATDQPRDGYQWRVSA